MFFHFLEKFWKWEFQYLKLQYRIFLLLDEWLISSMIKHPTWGNLNILLWSNGDHLLSLQIFYCVHFLKKIFINNLKKKKKKKKKKENFTNIHLKGSNYFLYVSLKVFLPPMEWATFWIYFQVEILKNWFT